MRVGEHMKRVLQYLAEHENPRERYLSAAIIGLEGLNLPKDVQTHHLKVASALAGYPVTWQDVGYGSVLEARENLLYATYSRAVGNLKRVGLVGNNSHDGRVLEVTEKGRDWLASKEHLKD
jgi:hypothetical protein